MASRLTKRLQQRYMRPPTAVVRLLFSVIVVIGESDVTVAKGTYILEGGHHAYLVHCTP